MEEERYGYIYITTNLINGKSYIGQHRKSYFDEKYFGSGKKLTLAIIKYGIDNFNCEILDWAKNQEELNEKEIYYIAHYKKIKKAEYNIAPGGNQPYVGYGKDNPFYGKTHSEETRKIISEKTMGRTSWLKGKKMSAEHIAKTRFRKNHTEESKNKITMGLAKSPKKCQYCNVELWRRKAYKSHMKEIHSGLGKKIASQKLVAHNRIANSIPYDCPYCDKKQIKSRGNLGKHIKHNHPEHYPLKKINKNY